jgi:FKBP-type peptidyl-prolyl cis-trans isomerase
MKHFFLIASTLLVATANAQVKKTGGIKPPKPSTIITKAATTAPGTIKNSLDSFSYALGMNIAGNLKQQNITNINAAAMNKAMNDVFNKKNIELTDQQANAVIQTKLQGNQAQKCESEKSIGKTFLEKNKKRAGVITLADGLQYEIVKKGDANSVMPKLQDTVVAHYAGTLIDGKSFDNSYERGQPLTIPVGGVIRGWTEILQIMHIGDKFKVYIPSELAYGDRGAGADIPGGATLIFEMELLEVKQAAQADVQVK